MALACGFANAEPALVSGTASPLSKAELAAAVRSDAVSIPTPGELLAALEKVGKPNWQAQYRPPIPTTFQSRAQIALNLGGLIADGYIAVQAEDAQQVKNLGKDIVNLAKTLGVSENVLRRGKSITDFAESNEWNTLKEELEATQNEVKLAMEEQRDDQLVLLVTLGAWVRGLDVISGWLSENYTPEAARLLRQPAIVQYLRKKIGALPDKTKGEPPMKFLRQRLEDLEALVTFPRDQSPALEQVKQVRILAAEMMKEIVTKK
jgi:hypothetical protein